MILIFYFSFFIITLSIIGYGNFILKLAKIENDNVSVGYYGLSGIFFINIYSYLITSFTYHNKFSNFIFLLIGVIFFFYFFKKITFKKYKLYFFLLSIFYIGILIGKPHDDFEYYHFPYSLYLNSFESIYGIGHLNHGFRTPSSIFYFNSVLYLPILEYFTFSYGAGYYMLFANIILIDHIKNKIFKKNTFFIFLSIFILLFINIFFYRIGEHGTDRSAQILILIFILELLVFLNFKINYKNQLNLLIILISLIISLKAFYLIYFVFIFLILDHLIRVKKKNLEDVMNILFKNFITLFAIVNLILIVLAYYKNTGCFVYPLSISCIESVEWSINKKEVLEMNHWYELWAKGGAAPDFRIQNPALYVQNYNWVSNWVDIYFFNKVSDFLLGLIVLSLILFFSFKKKQIKKIKLNRYKFLTLILFFLIVEWFSNHPSLRYGGYCLVAIFFAISISHKLATYRETYIKLQKKIFIFVIISLLIFSVRNVNRLHKEHNQYNYNPFIDVKYNLSESHFRINSQINDLKVNFQNCINQKKICKKKERFILKRNNNKSIIYKND